LAFFAALPDLFAAGRFVAFARLAGPDDMRLVPVRFRAGVLRPGLRIPVADSSRDSKLSTWLANRSIAARRSFISSPVIWRRSCNASRTRSLTPAAAPAVRSARVTTSSTTSCARSRVSPAEPTVVWTVRSTARRTASTPACFEGADFAGAFRAVDLRAVDFRAVDFRGVDFRGVDFRAVDFRAVDLRAVDFVELERRAVAISAT
jgi:hypothetical protein